MRNVLILIVFLNFSCAKPLVVDTIQPGDDVLNCKELKQEIAEAKMVDLNAHDIAAAMKIIEGTARSMGIEVVEG